MKLSEQIPLSSRHSVGPAVLNGRALRCSETRYRRLFEAARDGILLVDPATRKITDSNPFMSELLGYTREELSGKELWEIGLMKDEQASQSTFRELQSTFYVRYENLPLQSKTGQCHEVEFVSNIYDEDGVNVIQCNIRDITEHKKKEEVLRLREGALDEVSQGVFISDENRLGIYVNAAFTAMTGYEQEEILGKKCSLLQGVDTDPATVDRMRKALNAALPFEGEILNYRKDGTPFWNELSIAPIRGDKGGPVRFIGIQRDVTERKQAGEIISQRTAFFEAQANSSLDGIFVMDADGKKILQNRRIAELWKIPAEIAEDPDERRQFDWATSRTLYPVQFAEKVAWLSSNADETSRDEIELVDGTILDRYTAPVRDHEGVHYGRIWTFRDVTEARMREKKLAAALRRETGLVREARAGARAKSEFLASMSHEIRTPMNAILGFTELLVQKPNLTADSQEILEIISSSGEGLLRILNDVLDYSQLEAKGLKIEKSAFCPRDVVKDVHTLLGKAAMGKGLEFTLTADDRVPDLLWNDAGRLRQVLINLVGNAIKFTEKGSVQIGVRLSAHGDDGCSGDVEFFVCDTGMGIPTAQHEEIFEAFHQLDSRIARLHGGLGLGLAISKNLAGLMGGTITVRNREPAGSEFIFSLPQTAPAVPVAEPPEEELNNTFATKHPLRVLIVEDDRVNQKLMGMMLRNLGYDTLLASDGVEGVEMYRSERPNCVLMDLQMPNKNGFDATSEIRALEHANASGHPSFICAVTANVVIEDKKRCFDLGMNAFLNKPIKRAILAKTLMQASTALAD